MGSHSNLYHGPLATVPRKFSETTVLVGKKCTNLQCSRSKRPYSMRDFGGNDTDFKQTHFCTQCGRQTEDVTKPVRKSLVDEHALQMKIDEALVHIDNPNDPSEARAFHPTLDIWIPNIDPKLGRKRIDVDIGGLQIIHPMLIDEEKLKFTKFFAKELKQLAKAYGDGVNEGEVTVEWAVLAYVC